MLRPPVSSLKAMRWRSPVELELDAVVHGAFALHAVGDTGFDQQVYAALLKHACADAVLYVVAAAVLEDYRVDPLAFEQPCQGQAGRAGADDPDLGPELFQRSHKTACPCPTPTQRVVRP